MRKPLLLLSLAAAAAPAAFGQVVIAEVYGGGGNPGAPYKEDYVVLYNAGASAVDLSTYSIQYTTVQGTGWQKTNLTGSIAPGAHYVIITSTGGNGVANYPYSANVTSSPLIQISGRRGRVALSSAQVAYSGNTPTNPYAVGGFANLVDFVGWGGGIAGNIPSQYEGANYAPDMNVNNSIRRTNGVDTNNNGADFTLNNLSSGPLPVEMVSFSAAATGNRARVTWETASETNNAGFRLDTRAGEHQPWRVLGTIASKAPSGTTLEANRYAFTTDELPAGRHSLRLVQTDLDGVEHIAGILEVAIAPEGGVEVIVRGSRSMTLRLESEQRVSARMFDATGREVATLLEATVSSEATLEIPQSLAAGMYFVRITGERFATTRSVVIR